MQENRPINFASVKHFSKNDKTIANSTDPGPPKEKPSDDTPVSDMLPHLGAAGAFVREALTAAGGQYEIEKVFPGDVAISTGEVDHRPIAHDDGECLCLAVLDAPISLTGTVGRLLNPFIRF